MMTVEEELLQYREAKRAREIYKTELLSLENITHIKITNYSNDNGGGSITQEEMYWKWMQEKDEVKLKLALVERKLARIDKALDLLLESHPHECNAMLLYYVHNKGLNYIGIQIGYSRNVVKKKIEIAKKEFAKILNL